MNHHTHHKILILGGGYAGLMAAARMARERRARRAEITLVDARPTFTQRIRLHEMLSGREPRTFEYAPLLHRRGIRFVQARVKTLELGARRVLAWNPEGALVQMEYDTLILALGSATAAGVPGVAEHAVRLNDPAAIREAAARIQDLARSGGRVLVAGGGLTGIETATELAERHPGLRITLATRGEVGDDYSERGREHLRRVFSRLGVSLREGSGVRSLEAGTAWLEDGETVPFDLCVWAGGFEAPALAREAGLPVDRSGRVIVDSALRAIGFSDILVAGDAGVATFPDGRTIRMGCVSAMPLGAHAGENVLRMMRGEEPRPFGFAFQIRCISLGRKDGLVQFVGWDDTPRPKVWTRRLGVIVKELICRMTFEVVRNEVRFGVPLYFWPGRERPLVHSASGRSIRPAA